MTATNSMTLPDLTGLRNKAFFVGIAGLVDTLLNPSYSTAVGLLQWGAISLTSDDPGPYKSTPAMGSLGRLRDALRNVFP